MSNRQEIDTTVYAQSESDLGARSRRHISIRKCSQCEFCETDAGKRHRKQTGKLKKAKNAKKEQKKIKEAAKRHISDDDEDSDEEDDEWKYVTPAHRIMYSPTTSARKSNGYSDAQRFDLDDTPAPANRNQGQNARYRQYLRKKFRSQDVDRRRSHRAGGDGSAVVAPPDGRSKTIKGYRPRKIDYGEEE